MADKTLERMWQEGCCEIMLNTTAFHEEPIIQRFREKGVSCIAVCPIAEGSIRPSSWESYMKILGSQKFSEKPLWFAYPQA
jgi:hypothetical protein